jgi:hypothetical protein
MLGLADVRSYLLCERTQDHQMYTIVCNSERTWDYRTYALVLSANVRGGITGHTLTDSMPYSVNSTVDVCSKVSDVCYFLDSPLVNTCTYKTTFGPLGNSIRCTPL